MLLPIPCPNCDATLNLSEDMLGQPVRCGGCQEVFTVEAVEPRKRRSRADDDDDEDDRPRKRPRRPAEDEEEDRPARRRARSRRDDDYDDDEEDDDYDDRPRKRPKKKKKRKAPAGKPGLAVAAAILFLIWGGLGAILSIWSIVGLVTLLDLGAPATVIVSSLVQVVLGGCFAAYLIISGMKILNGEAEDLAAIGTAVLAVLGFVTLLSIVRVAVIAPVFAFVAVIYMVLGVLIVMSGAIIGAIFCMVCAEAYAKWQRR